jgi:hypothetical protein
VRTTLRQLRRYILKELAGSSTSSGRFPGQPLKSVLSPDVNNREQLGAITAKAMDTVRDPEGMPDHLLDPTVTPEECYGPVPPDSEPVYVGQDPFVRDSSPNPSGAIHR